MSRDHEPMFERYIGIDYSGGETANASLKGPRIYLADRPPRVTAIVPCLRGLLAFRRAALYARHCYGSLVASNTGSLVYPLR